MKSRLFAVISVLLVGWPAASPVAGQNADEAFYKQWVDYKDGEISVSFDQTPIDLALNAIRESTGFQIEIPAPADNKVLNLRLERSPLEPAMRSVISNIGFRNFALMYDEAGRPSRAVVLGTEQTTVANTANAKANEPQKLTADERDKIQHDLQRWSELKQEERGRIEDRLKSTPESDEREKLLKEYARQLLGIKK